MHACKARDRDGPDYLWVCVKLDTNSYKIGQKRGYNCTPNALIAYVPLYILGTRTVTTYEPEENTQKRIYGTIETFPSKRPSIGRKNTKRM